MSDLNDRAELSDRELDALVAEKIFKTDVSKPCTGLMTDAANGASWSCSACGWYDDHGAAEHKPIPRAFSTEIESAMEVVGAMFAKDHGWTLQSDGHGWIVESFPLPDTGYDGVKISDESLPRAICLAALSTAGEK